MSVWTLFRHRLALGLEPIDAVRQASLFRPIVVELELDPELDGPRSFTPMTRHGSGRHVLLDPEQQGESVDLRLYDRRRGWVPRRLRVPLPSADDRNVARRTRTPALFPGVNWDLVGGATALRGWVIRDGQAVRWAWIEVREPDQDFVVTRTRADDRGEFLLVLNHDTISPQVSLPSTIELDLRVHGPTTAVSPTSDEHDPLWDLPLEQLAAPGDPDLAAAGAPLGLPSGWAALGDLRVTLIPGRTTAAQLDL